MKLAQGFDNALYETFFVEFSIQIYLIVIGVLVSLVYVVGALTMRKVEMDKTVRLLSEPSDPMGCQIYIAVLGTFLFLYAVLVKFLNIYYLGVPIIMFFAILNFLMIGLVGYLIYLKIKKASIGLPSRETGDKKKFGEMLKETKYIMILISTMAVVGAGYAYQENAKKLAFEAAAAGSIGLGESVFWLGDILGRFALGVAAYFLQKSVNGYIFLIISAVCSLIGNIALFAILIIDIDGALILLIPAFLIGIGVGGFWCLVP